METKTEESKTMTKALEGEMIELKVTVFKPYVEFIKEYLAFFGSKKTIEDVCRQMICDDVKSLYRELKGAGDDYIEEGAWFNKHSFIACVSSPNEEEDSEES